MGECAAVGAVNAASGCVGAWAHKAVPSADAREVGSGEAVYH